MLLKMSCKHGYNNWSLFPSFCSNASDIAEVLPTLGPMLGNAMRDGRYPRMQQSVCLGIEILCKNNNNNDDDSEIKNNKLPNNNEGGDDDDDDNDEQKERKTINADATKFAPNFFPILFAGYEQQMLRIFKCY